MNSTHLQALTTSNNFSSLHCFICEVRVFCSCKAILYFIFISAFSAVVTIFLVIRCSNKFFMLIKVWKGGKYIRYKEQRNCTSCATRYGNIRFTNIKAWMVKPTTIRSEPVQSYYLFTRALCLCLLLFIICCIIT